jgi:pimeloyl-ACP methyl ester carboxylesterase
MSINSARFSEHRVPRPQGSVYARDYEGVGPAFVLMHGFPDNLHIYDLLVPYLVAAGRRVVTFDFLGYGASDKPVDVRYGFWQQMGDLEAIVEALHLEKIVPVGHDAGGPAAINFAIDYPSRVASLCILNTFYAAAPTLRLPELIELFATPGLKALTDAILESPEQLAWVLRFQQKKFLKTLPNGYLIRRCANAVMLVSTRARPATLCGAQCSFIVREKFETALSKTKASARPA